ncbi:COP1-interactive protein 1 [Impatiens glandulifera]|uniref:COP1-interactive protein 1 n=1 Tax=Impatiens glandulifera TaxID=253017 RepID=UPI001FB0B048|nr:COP1-interactive protein 1 [Impatiens glandulifera]XP_047341818.1 COP1-interactive protein 1 [Impatiens glandulifera]
MAKHKHRIKESILSFFGHHVDPDKHEQLKEYKLEMDSKFQKILESTEHDETDSSKTGILIDLVKEFQEQYNELYKHYGHLTEELKAKAHSKGENESSSSSSDSESDKDSPSRTKGSKNGKAENKYQKLINDIQQERDAANLEVRALKERLTDVEAKKEVLQLDYQTAFSKLQESETIIHDLRTQAEVSDREKSEFLQQIKELNLKLETSTQLEAELNQKLEIVSKEKTDLIVERENAIKRIEEEERTIEELSAVTSKIKDEKEALQLEFDGSRKELFEVNALLQTSKQEVVSLAEAQKATEEQNSFLSTKLLDLSNEIKVAQDKIEEIVTESSLLREKIKENEKELGAHKEMHETYQATTSVQTRSLEFKLDSLHTEKQEITKQRDDTVSELLKKLEDMEKDSLSKTETLTAQLKDLQVEIESLNSHKSKLEEQLQNERDESSEKIQDLVNQINTKQQELEHQQKQILELQSELGVKVQQISEHGAQIESLKEELTTKSSDQQRLLKENEGFIVQIENLQSEVDSLHGQKIQLEEKFVVENETLHSRILELSSSEKRLENELVEATAQISTLTEKVNSLEREIDNLSAQKAEIDSVVEKKAKEIADNILQIDNLRQELLEKSEIEKKKDDEISTLLQRLEDTKNDWASKVELQTTEVNSRQLELEKRVQEITEHGAHIESLKEELTTKSSDQQRMLKENEDLLVQIKNLQSEVDSLQGQKIQLEDQFAVKCNETNQLQVEKGTLEDRILELSSLQKRLENELVEASTQILTLTEKVTSFERETDTLSTKKAELDSDVEKKVQEIAENIILIENLRQELQDKMETEKQKDAEISTHKVELELLQNQKTELQLEVDSLQGLKIQLEEKIEEKCNEIKQMQVEKETMQIKIENEEAQNLTLTEKVNTLVNELDSLSSQKAESDLEMHKTVQEIEGLRHELLVKTEMENQKAEEISALSKKLEDTEKDASSRVELLTADVNSRQEELESLQNQTTGLRSELEAKVQQISEHRSEIEILKDELSRNTLHQENLLKERDLEVEGQLEGKSNEMKQILTEKERLQDRIYELEAKNAEASVKISTLENEFGALSGQKAESVLQIENLKNELQGKTLAEETSLEEVRNLTVRVKDLELEAETLTNRNHHLEEEIKNRSDDIGRLREEIESEKERLKAKISETESTIYERGMEFFSLQKKHEDTSDKITALTDQLELQMEISRRGEDQAAELLNKIVELEEIIEDMSRDLEHKGEELSNIEVKYRLLTQKHKVTDQLLVEKEESHKARVAKLLEEQQVVEEKNGELSLRISEYKKTQEKIVAEITAGAKGTMRDLDRFTIKFEEDYGHLESCVYEILNEVRIAKRWVKESRSEKERLMKKVQEKEEEGLAVKLKVDELEKKLRRYEEENSSLRVRMEGQIEEFRREKDEGMMGVGEEKKEAIRQLCISIEYHRSRCDYFKEMISKMSARGRGGGGRTAIAAS